MIIYISYYIQSFNDYVGGVGGFRLSGLPGFRRLRLTPSGGAFGFAFGRIGAGFRGRVIGCGDGGADRGKIGGG